MANLVVKKDVATFLIRGDIEKEYRETLQATSFLVEAWYKYEVPVDDGRLRLGVETYDRKKDSYTVRTDATSDSGDPYPEFIHEGTGSLKGAPDYGWTSGRVRDDDVAFGIGGIRPNKFADRAKEEAEPEVADFMKRELPKKLRN